MSHAGKRIIVSDHAAERMRQRGATQAEVESAIRSQSWLPAQRGKWHAKQRFAFDDVSPVNNLTYRFKAVDVVFAENPGSIVVVTVKVYYHD
jgi:hypothetical protein